MAPDRVGLRNLRRYPERHGVHVRGAADIVLAMLFAAELSPLATLLKR
jgi:hypothetical protein